MKVADSAIWEQPSHFRHCNSAQASPAVQYCTDCNYALRKLVEGSKNYALRNLGGWVRTGSATLEIQI